MSERLENALVNSFYSAFYSCRRLEGRSYRILWREIESTPTPPTNPTFQSSLPKINQVFKYLNTNLSLMLRINYGNSPVVPCLYIRVE